MIELDSCNHCFKEVSSVDIDDDTGMCIACINKLRLDYKNAKDKPAKKYKLKLGEY